MEVSIKKLSLKLMKIPNFTIQITDRVRVGAVGDCDRVGLSDSKGGT
jgi:hypothetical protein